MKSLLMRAFCLEIFEFRGIVILNQNQKAMEKISAFQTVLLALTVVSTFSLLAASLVLNFPSRANSIPDLLKKFNLSMIFILMSLLSSCIVVVCILGPVSVLGAFAGTFLIWLICLLIFFVGIRPEYQRQRKLLGGW